MFLWFGDGGVLLIIFGVWDVIIICFFVVDDDWIDELLLEMLVLLVIGVILGGDVGGVMGGFKFMILFVVLFEKMGIVLFEIFGKRRRGVVGEWDIFLLLLLLWILVYISLGLVDFKVVFIVGVCDLWIINWYLEVGNKFCSFGIDCEEFLIIWVFVLFDELVLGRINILCWGVEFIVM